MNKAEKSTFSELLERIARMEERDKHIFATLKEIKNHMATLNDELGGLEERVGKVENLYFEAKARYEKISLYWKVISFLLSPAITFGIICLIKYFLGMPIP